MQIPPLRANTGRKNGFTLIEMSIVLVIIGLIVGGVLVGQSLIKAAEVRAQVTQIEKLNTAVNTFRGKYGFLPGDIPDPTASQFGFQPRGTDPGQGDGNGLIESDSDSGGGGGLDAFTGEEAMFWVDLSQMNMIEGAFKTATSAGGLYNQAVPFGPPQHGVHGTQIAQYLPQAKLGYGGYVYVWSGGYQELNNGLSPGDSVNYFGLAAVTGGDANGTYGLPLMTPAQAYAIDKKMDDGMPQTGKVMALDASIQWASGTAASGNGGDFSSSDYGPVTSSGDIADGTAAGPNSCYDGGTAGNIVIPEQYSVSQNNGTGVNCVLSFKFQ